MMREMVEQLLWKIFTLDFSLASITREFVQQKRDRIQRTKHKVSMMLQLFIILQQHNKL